jgi:hypothetical protein
VDAAAWRYDFALMWWLIGWYATVDAELSKILDEKARPPGCLSSGKSGD